MEYNRIGSEAQDSIHVSSKIHDFFDHFRIGTLLHQCGVRKRHGYSVRSLIVAIFALPFLGNNFFRGIVTNEQAVVGKDAAYDLLRGCTYNWRRLLLMIAVRIHGIFNRLTDDQREDVLIIDDSTYDRSRSKKVELLSRIFDHSTGRYLRGFRLLTVCWSDGVGSLPLDFAVLSSGKAKNRYQEATKQIDKRCCAYRRRQEAIMKATERLGPMVERILKASINARYVLMDRWFTVPSNIAVLRAQLDVLIAHTTLVFMRYQFIAYCIRMQSDHRSFGDLFYACCDELSDTSFVETLHRLLTLAMEQLREMSTFCEQTASAFFNTVMQVALKYFNLAMSSMAKSEI